MYLADMTGKAMDRLGDNPMLLVRVLTVIVTPQLQTANVNGADFGEAIVGDALGRAIDAMLESIAAFSHGRRRELLQAMAAKSKRVVDLGIAKAMDKINDPALESRLMEAMDERMEKALQKALTSSDSVTDSLASSE